MYVATSTAIDITTFVASVNKRYQMDQPLVDNAARIHFCCLDRMNSASVWGNTFHELMTLMKGLED